MEQNKKSKDNKKKNEKLDFQWKKAGKTSFIWITIILVTVYFSSVLSENRNNEVEVEYTEYKNYLSEGAIKSAIIINKTFYGEFK
ncbi:MAG: cell division protein FtsH, partial [Candidatus Marinimicrobia bacterium]|nr:cell division protein FtsH [Candidatus Neomarinimicrobiota bacterium]